LKRLSNGRRPRRHGGRRCTRRRLPSREFCLVVCGGNALTRLGGRLPPYLRVGREAYAQSGRVVGVERSKIMRVAVIGAGNVGKALGEALATKGHDVVYGVRDLKKPDVKPPETVEKAIAGADPIIRHPIRRHRPIAPRACSGACRKGGDRDGLCQHAEPQFPARPSSHVRGRPRR
jgi:NADP oxidoreductase coenzyme F420-dependent